MKKVLTAIADALIVVPATLSILVMCIYGIFAKDEDYDPYI